MSALPTNEVLPQLALIGAGYWGKNLLRDFHKLGVLKAVIEPSEELRQQHQTNYPDLDFLASFDDLPKSHPNITAVVIAVPATLHYQTVIKAFDFNYHVFVEKPLALTYREGQELVALALEKGRLLMIGHLLQYHPAIIKIKEMIEQDFIGPIHYINSNRLNLGKIRQGENVLWSFAPHDISVILALLGNRLPTTVSCHGISALNPPIHDVSTTILQFDDTNQFAQINVNWLFPYKEQMLTIVGTKGMITFRDSPNDPQLNYYPQPVTFDSGQVILTKDNFRQIPIDTSKSPLTLECEHFIQALTSDTPVITDGNEALRVLAILQLAQRSLENGGIPIDSNQLTKPSPQPSTSVSPPNSRRSELSNTSDTVPYQSHPSAIIDQTATIGEGTKIWHNTHISDHANIGQNCSFGQSVFVGKGVLIGNNCRIQNNVNIYSGVTVEDGVFLGPNCTTTNDRNPRAEFSKHGNYDKTLIKRGASVGASATILPNIILGEYCLIGAGAVVTKSVPSHTVVVGNPAKPVATITEEGEITPLPTLKSKIGKKLRKKTSTNNN